MHVPYFPQKTYDSIDGKIICIRREKALHHTPDRIVPTREGDQWVCPSGQKFCGNHDSISIRNVECVPESYMCPVLTLKFINDEPITYTDTLDGRPIVDIKLS
jgi:hypothetical protein